jgi:hypothetical protein
VVTAHSCSQHDCCRPWARHMSPVSSSAPVHTVRVLVLIAERV